MSLLNKSEIQTIIIKLDKNKPRELELRKYLDKNVKQGINRKECILRMWEMLNVKQEDQLYNNQSQNKYMNVNTEKKENANILLSSQLKNEFSESDLNSF